MAKRKKKRNEWKPETYIGQFYVFGAYSGDSGLETDAVDAVARARKEGTIDESSDAYLVLQVVKVVRNEKVLAEMKPANWEAK